MYKVPQIVTTQSRRSDLGSVPPTRSEAEHALQLVQSPFWLDLGRRDCHWSQDLLDTNANLGVADDGGCQVSPLDLGRLLFDTLLDDRRWL